LTFADKVVKVKEETNDKTIRKNGRI